MTPDTYSGSDQQGYVRWQGPGLDGAVAYLAARALRPPAHGRTRRYALTIHKVEREIVHQLVMDSAGRLYVTATTTAQAVAHMPLADFLLATRLTVPPVVYRRPNRGRSAWNLLREARAPWEDEPQCEAQVAEEEITSAEIHGLFQHASQAARMSALGDRR